jgi:hypothetical protein
LYNVIIFLELPGLDFENAFQYFKAKMLNFDDRHDNNLIISDKIIRSQVYEGKRGHSLMSSLERNKYFRIMSVGFSISVNISVLFHNENSQNLDDIENIKEHNYRLLCESHNRVIQFLLTRDDENDQLERNQEQLQLEEKSFATGPVFSFLVALDILHHNPHCILALETYGNKSRFCKRILSSDFDDNDQLPQDKRNEILKYLLNKNSKSEIGMLMCLFDYIKLNFKLSKNTKRTVAIGVTVYSDSEKNVFCPEINMFQAPYVIKEPQDAVVEIKSRSNGKTTYEFIAKSSKYEKVNNYKPLGGFLPPDILKTNRSKALLKEHFSSWKLEQAQTYLPFLRKTNVTAKDKLQKWKSSCFTHHSAKEFASSHLQLHKLQQMLKECLNIEIINFEIRIKQRKSARIELARDLDIDGDWIQQIIQPLFETVYMVKKKLRFFNIIPFIEIANYCFVALVERMNFIIEYLDQNLTLPNSMLSLTLLEDSIKRINNFYTGQFLKGMELLIILTFNIYFIEFRI